MSRNCRDVKKYSYDSRKITTKEHKKKQESNNVFPAYVNTYQLLTSVNSNFVPMPFSPRSIDRTQTSSHSRTKTFFVTSRIPIFSFAYTLVYLLGRKIRSRWFNSLYLDANWFTSNVSSLFYDGIVQRGIIRIIQEIFLRKLKKKTSGIFKAKYAYPKEYMTLNQNINRSNEWFKGERGSSSLSDRPRILTFNCYSQYESF